MNSEYPTPSPPPKKNIYILWTGDRKTGVILKEKGRNSKEWKTERKRAKKRLKILMRSKYFHI
jgi:hypothetical protein